MRVGDAIERRIDPIGPNGLDLGVEVPDDHTRSTRTQIDRIDRWRHLIPSDHINGLSMVRIIGPNPLRRRLGHSSGNVIGWIV